MRKLLVLIFFSAFLTDPLSVRAANDLAITSIQRSGDCTTLQWVSHPGEWYTVFWTDNLNAPIFWRVARANVPSGGTNTVWREGCCASEEMMMMRSSVTSSESVSKISEKEWAERLAAGQARAEEGIKFLTDKLEEATKSSTKGSSKSSGGGAALLSSPAPPGGGGTNTNNVLVAATAKFYRVARVGAGFVDGWGVGVSDIPAGLTNVIALSAGLRDVGTHNMALRADGTVVAWGANSFGQTNVPSGLSNVIAIAAGGRHSVALKRNGCITNWGDTRLGQITNAPANLTNVVDVKAGLWHTLVLKADGTVAAWGDLFNRTNAVPAGLSGVTAISAGPRHCLALRCDGTVVAWGFSHDFMKTYLPTNVPMSLSNVIAISAGMEHNEALLADGTVCVWGSANNPALHNVPMPTNVISVSAGWHYGTVLLTDTTVQSWGQGDIDITMDSIVALSAGAQQVLVVRTNNDAPVIRRHPRDLFAAAGASTNLNVQATSATNLFYQWQRQGTNGVWSNLSGQTNTSLSFTNMQDSDNGSYRLIVSTPLRSIPSRVALVETVHKPIIASQSPELNLRRVQGVFQYLSVVVTNRGARFLHYDWFKDGSPAPLSLGSMYGLGFYSTNMEGSYYVVARNFAGAATSAVWQVSVSLAGEAIQWGDSSYGQRFRLSRRETNLVAVSAGAYFTLGLRENGTVFAWGLNTDGTTKVPTGLSNVTAIAAGYEHAVALREDGTVRIWGDTNNSQMPVPGAATNLTALAAGGFQVLGLRADGHLFAWGVTPMPNTGVSNVMGMSAGGPSLVGYQHALALMSNGTVQAWTYSGFPSMSPPAGLSNVVAVASGAYHALALKKDGTVVGWGNNTYGETNAPAGLSNVMKVVAGEYFSMALKNDGTVVSWGRNNAGQTNVVDNMGPVHDITAGIEHSVAITESSALEYPVNVSQDLLLICNTNVESVFVKDYYLAHRPLVSQANVLQIGYAPQETILPADFETAMRTPVLNWLATNATKKPKYWVLFLGVPSRINFYTNEYGYYFATNASVSVTFSAMPEARSPFITHINMGNVDHIGDTNACRAYIDKLEYFGTNYSPRKTVITASTGGYENSRYFFDDVAPPVPGYEGGQAQAALIEYGVPGSNILYQVTAPIQRGTNVSGYLSQGIHGWQSFESTVNGDVVFTGRSQWYVMMTIESYNGQRFAEIDPLFQGNFIKWFSSLAFGGTNFSNTPVGAVGHTDEPHRINVSDSAMYFRHWASGKSFSFAAWASRRTDHFQAVGDPLIKR